MHFRTHTKPGPRGVLDCKASDKDDPTVDPRFGKVGKQVCTDTGPLTKEFISAPREGNLRSLGGTAPEA